MWKKNTVNIMSVSLFLMAFLLPNITWSDENKNQRNSTINMMRDLDTLFFADLTKKQKVKVFRIISQHKQIRMKLRSDLINSKQELLDKIFSDNSGEELDRAIQNTTEAKTSIMMLRIKILKEIAEALPPKDAIQLKEKIMKRLLSGNFPKKNINEW
ncbi:MAG: hypothetical protein VXY22_02740 [Pseudomonadota bacterium]|nr:hypothetical protein [Pseudomonadota bacterium]